MPRYVVERTFPDGLHVPPGPEGVAFCREIAERNSTEEVTWVHSYVAEGGTKSFCLYDAPSPEAIRKAAEGNGLPVDRITQVRVLDPYFYVGEPAAVQSGTRAA